MDKAINSDNTIFALFRSTLIKKAVMAVTGVVLYGFVLGHMVGNLRAFQGSDKFNHYAEFLREVGSGGASSGRFTVSSEPMIDVRGLRSSWLTVETKSVFI